MEKVITLLDNLARVRDELDITKQEIELIIKRDRHGQELLDSVVELEKAEKQLKEEISGEVITAGHTIQTDKLQAVYSVRRIWDYDLLEGFALAHPEVLDAKSEKPSVSIRKVAKKKEA